jgi:hypothetical protein
MDDLLLMVLVAAAADFLSQTVPISSHHRIERLINDE